MAIVLILISWIGLATLVCLALPGAAVRPLPRGVSDRQARSAAAGQHEAWMEGSRYLNADLLREQLKPMTTTMKIAA